MKIFKVKASKYSYCDDISIVVVAESKERALEIAMKKNYECEPLQDIDSIYWDFDEYQYPLIVTEINIEEEQVVDASNFGA